jgi:hypothetical protein
LEINCEIGNRAVTICEENPNVCSTDLENWRVIQGRCFFLSNVAKNQEEATKDCRDKDGRLFEPQNKAANDLMLEYVNHMINIP